MNRKLLLGFVLVYVAVMALEGLEHSVLFAPTYRSLPTLFRGPGATMSWIAGVVYIGFAYAFTFVFAKGYEGRGIMEGVRYGLWISLLTSVTYSLAMYAAQPIPFTLALGRTIIGIVQLVIYGVILSLVFGKKGEPRTAQT